MLDPGKYKARPRVPEPAGDGSPTQPKWQIGEQEFEALMRMLDNLVRADRRSLPISTRKLLKEPLNCLIPVTSYDYLRVLDNTAALPS